MVAEALRAEVKARKVAARTTPADLKRDIGTVISILPENE
jgi:hypothetical protein